MSVQSSEHFLEWIISLKQSSSAVQNNHTVLQYLIYEIFNLRRQVVWAGIQVPYQNTYFPMSIWELVAPFSCINVQLALKQINKKIDN